MLEAPLATLEQLRIFVAVAEQLHVTRAAAALNMTQSAASAAIQALEMRLGTTLLERDGRHLELSEAGRVFLPEARAVLSKAFEAEQALAELEGLLRDRQTAGGLPASGIGFAGVSLARQPGVPSAAPAGIPLGSTELQTHGESPAIIKPGFTPLTGTGAAGPSGIPLGSTQLTNPGLGPSRWLVTPSGCSASASIGSPSKALPARLFDGNAPQGLVYGSPGQLPGSGIVRFPGSVALCRLHLLASANRRRDPAGRSDAAANRHWPGSQRTNQQRS
jgi:hypothetical protein